MITQQSVTKWLQDYVSAWKSYDPHAIGALFSEDATYRYNPFDKPVRGREAIVANWLEYRDEPNTYSAEYKSIAVDGNIAVSNGRSLYYEADGKTLKRQFDNIFVLRFDEDGRCVEFCEWFMQPRGQQ
jgi:ketosteroid isomerase-like protein